MAAYAPVRIAPPHSEMQGVGLMTNSFRIPLVVAVVACITTAVLDSNAPQAFGQVTDVDAQNTGLSQPADITDADIAKAIQDLGSNKFVNRQEAFNTLVGVVAVAIGALEKTASTGNLEISTRCVEALVQIAGDKDSFEAALAALERLSADPTSKVANLAKGHVTKLTMTDEDHAVAALTAAGARIFRGRDGDVFSVRVQRDREMAFLRFLPTLRSVDLFGAGVTDAGMESLASVKQTSNLSLMQTAVTARGLRHLKEMESLDALSLMDTSITAEGWRTVGDIGSLRRLSLHFQIDDSQLQLLTSVRQIESLYLSDVLLSEQSAGIINQLENIKRLSLTVTGADDRQCHWLAQIEIPLDLHLSRSPDISVAGWKEFTSTKLKGMTLIQTPITDTGLAHLGSIDDLEMLFINDAPVTNAGLSHLRELNSLRGLVLHGTKVTEEGVAELQKSLPNLRYVKVDSGALGIRRPVPNLPPVNFIVSRVTGKKSAHVRDKVTAEVVEKLKQEPEVDAVFLIRGELTDDQIALLADVPMKQIIIRSEKITDQGIIHLRDHESLESINVTSAGIGDACMEALASIPNLTKISLSNAAVTDDGVQTLIAGLAERGKITTLGLYGSSKITNAALKSVGRLTSLQGLSLDESPELSGEVLAEVGQAAGLTSLGLGGVRIDGSDLAHLRPLKLERVNFSKSQIMDETAQAMATALQHVRVLDLSGSTVTDSAMASIGKLKQLEWLSLRGTPVGDAGLEELEDLTKLKYLNAGDSRVTEYGKQQFQGAHPDMKINLLALPGLR